MTEIDPRLSRLYREAATETPSAAIDAAILAAAREGAATPRRRPQSRWSRWLVPVSLTATLVVGVSLGLLIEREHPEMLQGDLAGPAPTRPASAPAQAEKTEERAATAVAGSTAPAAAPPTRDAAPARRAAPRTADTFEAKARPAAPLPQTEPLQDRPPVAESLPAESIGGATATKAARESGFAADTATGLGAATAMPPAARMAAPATPESWLDAIRRLKRAGRDREAAAQLLEFRKAYPNYDVPEDLAGQPSPP